MKLVLWLVAVVAGAALLATVGSLRSVVIQRTVNGSNINIGTVVVVSRDDARRDQKRINAKRARDAARDPTLDTERALASAREQSVDSIQSRAIDAAKEAIASLADVEAVIESSPDLTKNRLHPQLTQRLKKATEDAARGRFGAARKLFDKIRSAAATDPSIPKKAAAEASFGLARLAGYEFDYRAETRFAQEANDLIPDSPRYAAYRAQQFARLNKDAKATECAERAESLLGTASPAERLISLFWLGDTYHELGEAEKSVNAYLNALKEYTNGAIGDDQSLHGDIVQSLAAMYAASFRNDEAGPLYTTALGIYKASSVLPIKLAYLRNNMALFYLNAGCEDVARDYADAVVGLQYGPVDGQDPIIGFSLGIRGRARFLLGEDRAALGDLRAAITQVVSAFGAKHWRVSQAEYFLAEVLLALGGIPEATEANGRSLSLLEAIQGRQGYWYASVLVQRARLEGRGSRVAAAEELIGDASKYGSQLVPTLHRALQVKIDLAKAEVAAQEGHSAPAIELVKKALNGDVTSWTRWVVKNGFVAPPLREAIQRQNAALAVLLATSRSNLCALAPRP